MSNLNIRVLGNNAIFVQYFENGAAKDAAFQSWEEALNWIKSKVLTK